MRRIRNRFVWAAALLVSTIVGHGSLLSLDASAQTGERDDQPRQGRPTLAILDIEATEAVTAKARADGNLNDLERILQAFDGQLIAALTQTNRFRVTARSDLERLLVDSDLQQVFADDPVRALRVLGTQYGLILRIDEYRDDVVAQKARVEGRGDRVVRARRELHMSVVATIYDIEKASAYTSVTIPFHATPLDKRWEGLGVDRDVLDAQMAGALDRVAPMLAQEVAHGVLAQTFPARIVTVGSGQVVVSWGNGTPIESGQVWRVFDVEMVEDIDFPGEFMEIEQPVGLIRIDTVSGRTSTASIVEDLGMTRGAVCRLVEDHELSGDHGE